MPEGPEFAVRASQILVVEDDAAIRERLQLMLEVFGYRVRVSGSVDEALAFAEAPGARFDALVTDLIMPGMNGRQLARRMRKSDAELGVVFLSGHADDLGLGNEELDASTRWLLKPFTPQQLERELSGLAGLVADASSR